MCNRQHCQHTLSGPLWPLTCGAGLVVHDCMFLRKLCWARQDGFFGCHWSRLIVGTGGDGATIHPFRRRLHVCTDLSIGPSQVVCRGQGARLLSRLAPLARRCGHGGGLLHGRCNRRISGLAGPLRFADLLSRGAPMLPHFRFLAQAHEVLFQLWGRGCDFAQEGHRAVLALLPPVVAHGVLPPEDCRRTGAGQEGPDAGLAVEAAALLAAAHERVVQALRRRQRRARRLPKVL
mmetsp:Transcript_74911/g.219456  ORF Transcript_74911/g.219456 Transcript_74911/m.219456 type:complete len:234 (-) Transcript_74911:478-1179(-)